MSGRGWAPSRRCSGTSGDAPDDFADGVAADSGPVRRRWRSLFREPDQQNFSAILIAGAGATCLNDGTKRVLFLCSRNRLRSPTAEQVFSAQAGIEVTSAGLDNDADVPCTPEVIEWADIVFVMEKNHRTKLTRRFKKYLKNARVICLDIPDHYGYM